DGNYTVTFSGTGIENNQGLRLSGDRVKDLFFLQGDANGDRRVNSLDFVLMALHFNQTGRTFGEGNFNYDANVNALDFNVLAAKFGTFLAAPASSALDAASL